MATSNLTFGPGGGPFGPGGGPFGPTPPTERILSFPLFAVLDFPLAKEASFSVAALDDNSGHAILDFPLAGEASFSVAVLEG